MINLNDKAKEALWERVDSSWKYKLRTFRKRFEQSYALYTGDHFGEHYEGDLVTSGFKCVTHNITATDVDIALARLTFQSPSFGVLPRRPTVGPDGLTDDVTPLLQARRIEEDFLDSGAWDGAQDALRNELIFGLGGMMVGWDFGTEDPTLGLPQELIEQYRQIAALPGIDAGDLRPPTPRAGEGPRAVSIAPHDLIYPPECEAWNWQDADYLGRFFTVSTEELKRTELPGVEKLAGYADPIRVVRSGAYADRMGEAMKTYGERDSHPYSVLAEVYFRRVYLEHGYRDPKSGRRYGKGVFPLRVVWPVETREPIVCEVWPYDLRDRRGKRLYPFRLFVHRVVPGRLQGQGMVEIAEPQQREVNAERSVVATIADEAARVKYEVDTDKLTAEGVTALQERGVGVLVQKKTGPSNQGTAVQLVSPPVIGNAVEVMGEHAIRDLNANTGVDEAAQGVAIAGVHTATEANLVNAKSGTRAAKADQQWQEHLVAIADMLWQLRLQFNHPGEPVRVVLPDEQGSGTAQTVPMDEGHLQPVDVTIVAGSTKQANKQEKVQNLIAVLQLGAQVGEVATAANPIGHVNGFALLKKLLAEMGIDDGSPGLFDVGAYQQQLRQMRQQAMAAQVTQAAGEAAKEHAKASAQQGPPPEGNPPDDLYGGEPGMNGPANADLGPPQGVDPAILEQLLAMNGGAPQ